MNKNKKLKKVDCTYTNGKKGVSLKCRIDGDLEKCSESQQGSNAMLKKLAIVSFCMLFIQSIFAQDTLLHGKKSPEYSTQFLKRIENNIIRMGLEEILEDGSIRVHYNLKSKTDVEKLFFGDFNGPVEFCFEPEFGAPFGFRILRMGKSYSLEVKNIPNYEKVRQELMKKYSTTGFSLKQLESVPDSIIQKSAKHNYAMWQKQREESLILFKVETQSFPVSNQLVETLREKIAALIEHFDGNQVSWNRDYRVTFRCVVENEVWTLSIKDELQGDALVLSDLCRQIVADAGTSKLDESNYLEELSRSKHSK